MIADLDQASIAAAGEWILLFSPEQAPIIIHVPSREWTQDTDGHLAGLQAPDTVWTGDRLVVWGGASTPTESNPSPANGAIWTPPNG
jgi:hypothetical protein